MISVLDSLELSRRNTLALPSVAERAVCATSIDQVRAAIDLCGANGWPMEILGGGSNVVLRAHIDGCLLLPDLRWIAFESRKDSVLVRAGAGVRWHDLVRFCLGHGLAGVESLALIPGSVGAAPIQNIGAYGIELDRCLEQLTAVSCRDGSIRAFERSECEFGYRDSVFKREPTEHFVVVEVSLMLSRSFHAVAPYADIGVELARMGAASSVATIAEAVIRVRRRKLPDPRRVPNAGSFFKNPIVTEREFDDLKGRLGDLPGFPTAAGVKIPAARLIDVAGWKGRRLGRAGVWHRQALVLINLGGATAADLLGLSAAIADDVGARYGVALELEPRVLGRD